MPNPCKVCIHPQRRAIEEMILAGASDYAIARQFATERVGIGRHRRRHIVKPAQDRLAILTKDSAARRERQELAVAAASEAPTPAEFVEAFFGLKAQAEKLQRIEDRLERMAALAEESQSPNGVAQVAAQQLRSVEVGAKVAGVGGYAPTRAIGGEATRSEFSVNIVFGTAGRTETISVQTGGEAIDIPATGDAERC